MSSQEHQPEKLKSIFCSNNDPNNLKFIENVKYGVVFQDPITNKQVILQGSSTMNMTMEEYAKLRVPDGVNYNIVDLLGSPNETLPELNFQEQADKSLNMFYRYLNAL